jgi:hypothetical protein
MELDSKHFDALARTLAARPTRRAVTGAALAGALGAAGLGWPGSAAGKRKKKKKKCRGCPACKQCVKGRCKPVPNFTPCGGVCQECQGGQCLNKPNDSACNGDGKCLEGVCNPRPNCISANVGGCASNPNCCSDDCEEPPQGGICLAGANGKPCRVNGDCDSNSCIGYVCAA